MSVRAVLRFPVTSSSLAYAIQPRALLGFDVTILFMRVRARLMSCTSAADVTWRHKKYHHVRMLSGANLKFPIKRRFGLRNAPFCYSGKLGSRWGRRWFGPKRYRPFGRDSRQAFASCLAPGRSGRSWCRGSRRRSARGFLCFLQHHSHHVTHGVPCRVPPLPCNLFADLEE